MEISETTVDLILSKIDAVEKNMLDKMDSMKELFSQKIQTIESNNCKTEERLDEHEEWLERHNTEITALKNTDGEKAKQIVSSVLKVVGGIILAYILYRAFPNVMEVIK